LCICHEVSRKLIAAETVYMSAKTCCRQQEVYGPGGRMWSRLVAKKPMLLAYGVKKVKKVTA
jgi:hypothetical protein